MTQTFVGWLRSQRDRDDPVGDVARDVLEDRRSGHLTAKTPRGVVSHIRRRHGVFLVGKVARAFDRAIAEYQAAAEQQAREVTS